MKFVDKRFRLIGITPLLGSIAMNKEEYKKYIASNAVTDDEKRHTNEDAENVVDVNIDDEIKVTGFYRDTVDGSLILKGYQIKGFFKEAVRALKDQIGIKNYISKVDNLVFIVEHDLPIMRDGNRIFSPDSILDRPLRAQTAQGQRVALAYSEQVVDPWYVDLTIRVLENNATAGSKPMSMEVIEDLLSYGELKGLLQWRNAGYGSFKYKELKENN